MNYNDTEEVLRDLKSVLESACGEKLEEEDLGPHSRSTIFRSENFQFDVYFSFLQARVPDDFEQPIENRLDEVLSGFDLGGRGRFELTSRSRDKINRTEIPIEYCILRA